MDRKLREELQKIADALGSNISPNAVKNGNNFAVVEQEDHGEVMISHLYDGDKTRKAAYDVCQVLKKYNYLPDLPKFDEVGPMLNVTIKYKKGF